MVGSSDGYCFPSLAEVLPTTNTDTTHQWTYIEDEFVLVHAVIIDFYFKFYLIKLLLN